LELELRKIDIKILFFRSGVHGHNCLLSELAQRDLRPNMDFLHDEEKSAGDGWRLMAWDWSDERCRLPGSVNYGSNSLVPWKPQSSKCDFNIMTETPDTIEEGREKIS
jgi:hypothetical protein